MRTSGEMGRVGSLPGRAHQVGARPATATTCCHRRCTGRVRLRLTAWPSFQPVFIQRFYSKQDVIDACLASGHLPFLLDGRLAATMRGALPQLRLPSLRALTVEAWHQRSIADPARLSTLAAGMRAVDGAFCRWAAMLRQQPGALLGAWLRSSSAAGSSGAARLQQPAELPPATPHGQHGQSRRFTLDYVNDDRLERTLRFAAVRLRPAEGLHQLVRCGEAYSQRLHARGVWEAWLGSSGGTGSDVHESNA